MTDFDKILILDGGMGTMIQRERLSEADFRGTRFADWECALKGCNDLLVITCPECIEKIHNAYLDAGADIIETDSFNANAISLADYGMQDLVYEINLAAARLARHTADAWSRAHGNVPRFVAGSIGPTNRSLSLSPSVDDAAARAMTWKELTETYRTQIGGLIDGGVDCLLVETVFDTLNAKAALWAADEAMRAAGRHLPIMLSVTLTESGRTLSGQTLEAMLASVAHAPLASVGLNCGFGAEGMLPWIEQLAALSPLPVSVYPNAGLPNEMGEYDETPELMAEHIRPMLEKGLVNIVGGCCGTTPEHIRLIAEMAGNYKPRVPASRPNVMRLSGYELREVTPEQNFLNIGERCNVAGSRKFLRLINEKNYDEAVEIARRQVVDGAQVIDVNMDDAMLDAPAEMAHFLRLLATEPDVARVPVMIDSSNWDVITAGLEWLQGKGIVNSISLKDGEDTFVKKAEYVRRMGAAVVVMAFDEKGQADTFERKIEVCRRSYNILTEKAGFNPQDIIFDPNVLAVATGISSHNNYAADFISATEWIKANLPGAKVSGGVSNLSFSFRGNNYVREAMHSAFLYHAIGKGLDMAIVNAGAIMPYEDIPADLRKAIEDVIFNLSDDATDNLVAMANAIKEGGATTTATAHADELSAMEPGKRLSAMILKGVTEGLEATLDENYRKLGSAVAVIDGPLMAGMNHVGELFGAGKLFLPQVVKSARTMKQAVAWLNPLIEADRSREGSAKKAGRIVLATVKGDVHDIGKNIVAVIMRCNGFEVKDLGVMVPPETIIKEAVDCHADLIGVSGLITPSLEEMRRLAALMEARNMDIPLMVGGATTSELHTAVKIAPEYHGAVVYTRDAAMMPAVAQQLLTDRDRFIKSWNERQQNIRNSYNENSRIIPLTKARSLRLREGYEPVRPRRLGISSIGITVAEARGYINKIPLLAAWKVRQGSAEADKLLDDAALLLDRMERRGCAAKAIFGLWSAEAENDTIIINGNTEIPTLRQQLPGENGVQMALSDFIAPRGSGVDDYIGTFAVTIGKEALSLIDEARDAGDDYAALLLQTLADRIVEASTEVLHRRIRHEFWGYASPDEEPENPQNMLRQNYRGIRPAVGYPSLPDQSVIFDIDRLMPLSEIGITLTENGAMSPASSVCGLVLAHPGSHYFMVGAIGDDQRTDYASRRHITVEELKRWLR